MDAHLPATAAIRFFAFPTLSSAPWSRPYGPEPSARYQSRFVDARVRQCGFIVSDTAAHEVVCCGAPTSETSSWCSWTGRRRLCRANGGAGAKLLDGDQREPIGVSPCTPEIRYYISFVGAAGLAGSKASPASYHVIDPVG